MQAVLDIIDGRAAWCVVEGDSLDVLRAIPDASVDAWVTDPPAGIGFMNRKWDAYTTSLPPADFMNWFAGFVDGEGCFSVHRKPQDTYDCQFSISLRADDKPILVEVQRTLGIGTVATQKAKEGDNPKARYCVSSKADCLRLVEILRAAPLRAKKALDFELWVEALDAWMRHRPREWGDMADARERLMASRAYTEYGKVAGPPARRAFIAEMKPIFKEALRVLKPGAHALVWALPRTSHWTATALEDAGFEIRDIVNHWFGSGFPKSLDVSKAIDKAAGAERETVGSKLGRPGMARDGSNQRSGFDVCYGGAPAGPLSTDITAPATDAAAQWSGWGTALKPAAEHWILCRKPIVGTVAANVERFGTGALNVDACRVNPGSPVPGGGNGQAHNAGGFCAFETHGERPLVEPHTAGRWPPNLLLSHSPECNRVGERRVNSGRWGGGSPRLNNANDGTPSKGAEAAHVTHGAEDSDGLETVAAYRCIDGCPVKALDEQSGERPSGGVPPRRMGAGMGYHGAAGQEATTGIDSSIGTASRFFPQFQPTDVDFFYTPKADRAEREKGCEHLPAKSGAAAVERKEGTAGLDSPRAGAGRTAGNVRNHHPTVKSVALMTWLVRLITPPGGVVLDSFAGSGSTGIAAVGQGFRFIGIERDPEYVAIARARIEGDAPLLNRQPESAPRTGQRVKVGQPSLFGSTP